MATRGRTRDDGSPTWIAHWRLDNGKQKAKTFSTKKKALAYEAQKRREKDDRVLGIRTMAEETLLEDWIAEWWELHIKPRPLNTRENYERPINRFIDRELGRLRMSELRPYRIAEMRDRLLEKGETPSAVADALTVLSSCLGKAVERGFFDSNPCAGLKRAVGAKSEGTKLRWAVSPIEIEHLRSEFLRYRAPNSGAWSALRSATLVSVMGYAGLRPSEAMALKVKAYLRDEKQLVIEAVRTADYREGDTKTHRQRPVELVEPLVRDLELWIEFGLGVSPEKFWESQDFWLFPDENGKAPTRYTHRNWTARPWKRTRDAVVAEHPEFQRALADAPPKELRGAYVSLLARAGHSDADIADMSGHSVDVLRRHYLRAIRALRGKPSLSEIKQIELARSEIKSDELARRVAAEIADDSSKPRRRLVRA